MNRVQVTDMQEAPVGHVMIAEGCLESDKGAQAVHETVVAYLANQRQGNASALTRGEVSGGGRKPWRQKGTGRARVGSTRSPLWRGGGVVFGPKPRDYETRIPKGVRRLAFRRAFTDRWLEGRIRVVSGLQLAEAKTREAAGVLKRLGLTERPLLVVVDEVEPTLALATRNLPDVVLVEARNLNTYQLLRFRQLLFTRPALDVLAERLGGAVEEASGQAAEENAS